MALGNGTSGTGSILITVETGTTAAVHGTAPNVGDAAHCGVKITTAVSKNENVLAKGSQKAEMAERRVILAHAVTTLPTTTKNTEPNVEDVYELSRAFGMAPGSIFAPVHGS